MNPIFQPCHYPLDELKSMKARLLLKGIDSWNHTQYSLICQLIGMMSKPGVQKPEE